MAAHSAPDETGRATAISSEGDADLLHELREALTALGNYLAAIDQILHNHAAPTKHVLSETVAKSLDQYERVRRAVQGLATRARNGPT